MEKKWKSDEGITKEKLGNMEGVLICTLNQVALQNISQCLVNMSLKRCTLYRIMNDNNLELFTTHLA